MKPFPWDKSFDSLGDALDRLEEILQLEPDEKRIVIDATIQRFEFTFELFWKTLKRFLQREGIVVDTPRETLMKAYQMHWINDEQIWLQMMRDRNSTSDIYDEAKAQEIYSRIREYQPRFRVVYSLLEKKK